MRLRPDTPTQLHITIPDTVAPGIYTIEIKPSGGGDRISTANTITVREPTPTPAPAQSEAASEPSTSVPPDTPNRPTDTPKLPTDTPKQPTEETDKTSPTAIIISPSDGAKYDQNELVIADYTCQDEPGGSGIASCVGTVSSGQPISTSALGSFEFTVTATDKAGNTSQKIHSYEVIDGTDPTVTIITPSDGAIYLQNELVIADYTCQDEPGGSGIASCVGDVSSGQPISTSALGSFEFTVTATDGADNTSQKIHSYEVIDGTDPTVTIITPFDGAIYLQNDLVIADYICQDEPGGSGIASCVGDVSIGKPISTFALRSFEFTVTATDKAGNTSQKTHRYEVIDGTDPTVTIITPSDGAMYAQNDLVTADYTCQDEPGGSGIASCVGDVSIGQPISTFALRSFEFTVTATDMVGNTSQKTHRYKVKDVTDPTVKISSPSRNASYDLNQEVFAAYTCQDEPGGSGIASCVGTVPDGAKVDTSSVRTHVLTVTATDKAGNTSDTSYEYDVSKKADVINPTVTILSPTKNAMYDQNQDVNADYFCQDEAGGGGVGNCFLHRNRV